MSRIISDFEVEPFDIVLYKHFYGKYGNHIFMVNKDYNMVNISLEMYSNYIGNGVSLLYEAENQWLREFAREPKSHNFHNGEGYIAPNGETCYNVLKYAEWRKKIFKREIETIKEFYNYIESVAIEKYGLK